MKKERIFWGVFLLVGALALIVGKLGYFSDINAFSLMLTILLIAIIIKSIIKCNFPGILFPIAFVGIIYDKQLGIESITPWTILLAALLGSIGLSLIFNKRPKWSKVDYKWDDYKSEIIDIEDEGHIKVENSFAESIKYINTDKFEQANLRCNFGSMKIYFDNATMLKKTAIVQLEASFCGVELFIPRGWAVENRTNVSFSGVDERGKRDGIITNTLILVGDIKFSGVEIIYI